MEKCTTTMPIYYCVCQKNEKANHLYLCLLPHCILLFLSRVCLVLLGFFSQLTLIIVLFCGMFITIEIEKSLVELCKHMRCRSLWQSEMLEGILNNLHLEIQSIIINSFIFKLVCCNRKHRREVLWNIHYFWTLIGSTESCLECKQIKFLRFLNKWYLLQLKYFFKVRFACKIKLILSKCANIMRASGRNIVSTMLFS